MLCSFFDHLSPLVAARNNCVVVYVRSLSFQSLWAPHCVRVELLLKLMCNPQGAYSYTPLVIVVMSAAAPSTRQRRVMLRSRDGTVGVVTSHFHVSRFDFCGPHFDLSFAAAPPAMQSRRESLSTSAKRCHALPPAIRSASRYQLMCCGEMLPPSLCLSYRARANATTAFSFSVPVSEGCVMCYNACGSRAVILPLSSLSQLSDTSARYLLGDPFQTTRVLFSLQKT